MKNNIKTITAVLLAILLLLGLWQLIHPFYPAQNWSFKRQTQTRILLVPLDGRPPCKQFVIDAGLIAGIEIITPPSNLQDYYSQAGDTNGMRQWLLDNANGADAVIISIDQLLYGGLLAAREKDLPAAESENLITFLKDFHAKYPAISLYAFSILPRQTPQDTIDGYQERKDLLEYSRLTGRKAAGLAIDETRLANLKASIPPASLSRYLSHFTKNEKLNEQLIKLAQEDILTQLILGQDDGEPFSIPNIEKEHLRKYILQNSLAADKVFLTHGADEIALDILAKINNQHQQFSPRIYVDYNASSTPAAIMPYMAIDTAATVSEKIAMLGGIQVSAPTEADFILYISANDANTISSRLETVKKLQTYQKNSQPVALVDLSKHFSAKETVLPLLIENNYPLNSLLAYAGWNTTSNAIGTSLAEASLYLGTCRQAQTIANAREITACNIAFLQNRLLEDYFYLKEDIDVINHTLQKAGYINTADLDIEHNYRWANRMLQQTMLKHIAVYKQTKAFRKPVEFTSPAGNFTLMLQNISADMSYPWPRTFEIWLHTTPFFAIPQ